MLIIIQTAGLLIHIKLIRGDIYTSTGHLKRGICIELYSKKLYGLYYRVSIYSILVVRNLA